MLYARFDYGQCNGYEGSFAQTVALQFNAYVHACLRAHTKPRRFLTWRKTHPTNG